MNKQLLSYSLNKQFIKYVIPSMMAMLLGGFYYMIDGLFVGNKLGAEALASINIVYPVQAVLNSLATGIGIGGSVLMSIELGRNNLENSRRVIFNAISVLFIIGIVVPIFFLFQLHPILSFLGAEGSIYDGAKEYIYVILLGGLAPVLGNGLNPFIRNHGKTVLATLFMCSGLVTNIVLDYIYIYLFDWGLFGAGFATITAQVVVAVLNFSYLIFLSRKHIVMSYFIPKWQFVKKFITIGLSPFGQTFIPSLIIVLTNWQCLTYGGDNGLAIYSVMSYLLSSVQLLLQGVGDGVQPLISYYFGAENYKTVTHLYKKTLLSSIGIGMFLMVIAFVFTTQLSSIFGISTSLLADTNLAIRITSLSFVFFGIARCTSAFLYAIGKTKFSALLIYLEPCLIAPVLLVSLGFFFGLNGIWFAYPCSQVMLCIVALILRKKVVLG